MSNKVLSRKYYYANLDKMRAKSLKFYYAHKKQINEQKAEYRKTHRTILREGDSRSLLKLRTTVLTHYGNGKCACVKCGFDNIKALSIDHINGMGTIYRRNTGISSKNFYRQLRNNGFPLGYQTLCMNCQYIKREVNNELYKH
jgi:hypothetical protein